MVEVGELEITGTMDVDDINRGFDTINRKLDIIDGKTKGATSDFNRLGSATKIVASGLTSIGASTIALINLAKDSPALAGSMASMSVSFDRIKRSLGEGLQGPVNAFSGLMQSLANFAESDPGIFTALSVGVGALAGLFGLNLVTKGAALTGVLKAMKGLTFTSGAIAGLAALAGVLTVQNFDDIKKGFSTIGGLFTSGETRQQFKQNFHNMSDKGGIFGDIFEGVKMFWSPVSEKLFGADPYTPKGWRDQGEFVRSGRGVDFIKTQQNISYSSRNIVLGQGDLAP